MKNSFQIISFFVIIIITLFSTSTVNAQASNNKNRIYISPINLLSPIATNAQVTYGRTLKNNNELQFTYSHRLPNFKLFLKDHITVWQLIGVPKIKKGFGIGTEYQMFMNSSPRTYVGIGASVKHDKVVMLEELFNFLSTSVPGWNRTKSSLNLKLGHKFNLGKRFILDLHTGIGITYLRNNINDSAKSFIEDETEFSNGEFIYNYPVNLKIAYSF